jgi:hypothetical protein
MMAKMTHWRTGDVIDVPADKRAVYVQQGWDEARSAKASAAAVTRDAVDEPAPAKKTAAKKTTAKKAAKKS